MSGRSGVPTLLIAAPASGSGKTTVTCALAAALRARGLDVRTFKAGPDYLDPLWHEVASGGRCRNLDGWMTGRAGVEATLARGCAGGDLALIEGVMGLFDGRSPSTLEGSGAELAAWLDLPVVVVMDASGMARTAAALVAGLANYNPEVKVSGVIFNRVGSKGHGRLLAEAMQSVPQVRCLGALERREDLAIPSRHLGLVSPGAAVKPGWADALVAWASALDLDGLFALARTPSLAPVAQPAMGAPRVRLGLALDDAFHFYYQDNLDLLEQAGATLVPFSPLADHALPPDLQGLYLGGGYPEAHAAALSANAGMLRSIRDFPGLIYAECGGLMYLGEALDGRPMCGRLPIQTRMTGRGRALGYREVATARDTPLGPAGTVFRGHEFHYSELVCPPALAPAYRMSGRAGAGVEGWGVGRVLGSYVHAHFGSNPILAPALVAAAEAP